MAHVKKTPVARSVPFDNSTNGFQAEDVQAAIEEIGASASPGFSWGRNGNSSTGTWLNNEGVSSNLSGRLVFISNPSLAVIFTANRNLSTYTLGVYTHDGNEINLTLVDTLVITSARGGFKTTNISIPAGKQLAVRVETGSAQDIVAGVILKGNS
jgi:hypothetical protein